MSHQHTHTHTRPTICLTKQTSASSPGVHAGWGRSENHTVLKQKLLFLVPTPPSPSAELAGICSSLSLGSPFFRSEAGLLLRLWGWRSDLLTSALHSDERGPSAQVVLKGQLIPQGSSASLCSLKKRKKRNTSNNDLQCLCATQLQGTCFSFPRNYTLCSYGKRNTYHLKEKDRRKPKPIAAFLLFL